MHRFQRRGMPAGTTPARRRRIRLVAFTGGAAALGFGGLYVTGLLVSGADVPDGTRVRGVDIGGLSRSQAEEKLDQELGKTWASPLKVRIGDRSATVDARAAGLRLDSEATVARAVQPRSGPLTAIGRLFSSGKRDIEPVTGMDQAKARAVLAKTAKEYDRTAREGAVTFHGGKPVVVQPRSGQSLDVDRSLAALDSADPSLRSDPVRLPVRQSRPRVDAAEVNRAMKEFATPAMSAPVTLTTGGRRIEIGPVTVGNHLTMKPDKSNRLAPRLDGQGLRDDPTVVNALGPATGKAVEARLGLDGERVVVASDGKPGQRVTSKAIQQAVLPLLTKTGTARTGAVAAETVQPTLTRDTVGPLGIKEKMSTFTVNFEPAPYRTKNIGRAAELLNGSLVRPGENWSFNRTVGERTKANGFVDGIIINNNQFEKAAGGGVSAVATTVFNALFFAGVKPLEHGAHSFYIERYPEGREATVVWGSLDLRFANDSGNAIYIQASATDTSITVTFLGTKKYDAVEAVTGPRTEVKEPSSRPGAEKDCLPQTPLEGFNVAVDRVFTSDGKEVKRETFNTHYAPRDEVTCDAEPVDPR